jgi:hypothetical protein
MAGTHAKDSPSGYDGWSNCVDWASDPNGSKHADLGTDAHELAAICLTENTAPAAYLGRLMSKGNEVDLEMVEAIDSYLAVVRSIHGKLLVEVALPLTPITGEEDAFGTSDAVVLTEDEIVVIDLKYGKGISVSAEGNGQLRIYGLAALIEYGHLADFKSVRTMIVQPRI